MFLLEREREREREKEKNDALFADILNVFNDKNSNRELMLNLNFTNIFGFENMLYISN